MYQYDEILLSELSADVFVCRNIDSALLYYLNLFYTVSRTDLTERFAPPLWFLISSCIIKEQIVLLLINVRPQRIFFPKTVKYFRFTQFTIKSVVAIST